MAAYVQNVITDNTTAGNKAATITPATNGLLVVVCHTSANATAPTVTDNQTGGTYTLVGTCLRASSASGAWIFIRNALSTAVAHVVTMTVSGDSGGGLNVFEFSGMLRSGADASKQAAVQDNGSAAATPAPVFGASVLTGNPTIGLVHNATSPATMTPPASWTERQDVGYATPTSGFETVTRDSGFTGTTVTWGGTSATAFGALVVELDTSAAPPAGPTGISYVSETNDITYTTGSVSFTVGTLPIAFTNVSEASADWVLTDSLGGTWSKIVSAVASSGTTTLWIRDALASGSACTLTYSHASGASGQFLVSAVGIPSMTRTGSSAIKSGTQFGKQDSQTAGGTPAPALPSAATTTNPTVGAVANKVNPATFTPPGSWTELHDIGSTAAIGLETVYRASGFTGTTVTWGSADGGSNTWSSIIAELDLSAASTGGPTFPRRRLPHNALEPWTTGGWG